MSFSSDRGIRHRRRRAGAAIELTPLIDITFQLLIFFLLTATFQDDSSLDVELERAKNKLANESFVAKAPAAVVDKERARVIDLTDKLARVENQLAKF